MLPSVEEVDRSVDEQLAAYEIDPSSRRGIA